VAWKGRTTADPSAARRATVTETKLNPSAAGVAASALQGCRLIGEARGRLDRCRQRQRRQVDRRLDEAPRGRLLEDFRRELRVQRVSRAVRDQVADYRIAHEREIADRVQNLVADELVLEAERVVQDARLAEHDGVLERSAERQPVLPHHLDVLEER